MCRVRSSSLSGAGQLVALDVPAPVGVDARAGHQPGLHVVPHALAVEREAGRVVQHQPALPPELLQRLASAGVHRVRVLVDARGEVHLGTADAEEAPRVPGGERPRLGRAHHVVRRGGDGRSQLRAGAAGRGRGRGVASGSARFYQATRPLARGSATLGREAIEREPFADRLPGKRREGAARPAAPGPAPRPARPAPAAAPARDRGAHEHRAAAPQRGGPVGAAVPLPFPGHRDDRPPGEAAREGIGPPVAEGEHGAGPARGNRVGRRLEHLLARIRPGDRAARSSTAPRPTRPGRAAAPGATRDRSRVHPEARAAPRSRAPPGRGPARGSADGRRCPRTCRTATTTRSAVSAAAPAPERRCGPRGGAPAADRQRGSRGPEGGDQPGDGAHAATPPRPIWRRFSRRWPMSSDAGVRTSGHPRARTAPVPAGPHRDSSPSPASAGSAAPPDAAPGRRPRRPPPGRGRPAAAR